MIFIDTKIACKDRIKNYMFQIVILFGFHYILSGCLFRNYKPCSTFDSRKKFNALMILNVVRERKCVVLETSAVKTEVNIYEG